MRKGVVIMTKAEIEKVAPLDQLSPRKQVERMMADELVSMWPEYERAIRAAVWRVALRLEKRGLIVQDQP
jgi:hypothetical protein